MLAIGIPCISLALVFYWTFPARVFRGAPAAAALPTINSIGNLGGLVGQNLMPALAAVGGSASAALIGPCACRAVLAGGALVVPVRGRSTHGRAACRDRVFQSVAISGGP